LSFPPDLGVPAELVNLIFASGYDQFAWTKLDLVGAGTQVAPLPALGAGARAILVKVDASSTAAPVNLRFNGGGASGEIEVSPGGFFFLCSGAPVAGVTSMSVVYTSNVTVRTLVLG